MESLYGKTKGIIEKYGFQIKKGYGQHFLTDELVKSKILSATDITKDDLVIEIGPGIGTLTEDLCRLAGSVTAIEIDLACKAILEETLSEYKNLTIIHGDILKASIQRIIKESGRASVKVAANLPYNIAATIIMMLLERKYPIDIITVMVQKEVADRLMAQPGSKNYGALSLLVKYYSVPYLAARVPRNCFLPRPNVDSAVVRLNVLKDPLVSVSDEEEFFRLIKAAFSQRRKTLVNCLFNSGEFGGKQAGPAGAALSKKELAEILVSCGFSENIRGEALNLNDFAVLYEKLKAWA